MSGIFPDLHVHTLAEIPLDELSHRGIRGFLLDVDNTLTPWHQGKPAPGVTEWLRRLAEREFKACLLSNSAQEDVEDLARRLSLPAVWKARKPSVAGFRRGCAILGLPPTQVAMVGDQMFTDVWGGNRAGLYTILTDILDQREFWGTRLFSRTAERLAGRRSRRPRG